MLTEQQRRVRGRIGRAASHGDTEAVAEHRREFRFLKAQDYIRALVETAPPLTDEQRDKLAIILRPTPGARA